MSVQPMTFQAILRSYGASVEHGAADTDLNPRERRLVRTMLNLASNDGRTLSPYASVTAVDRDAIIRGQWGRTVSDAYFLVVACSPASQDAYSRAQNRAIEIIRNV